MTHFPPSASSITPRARPARKIARTSLTASSQWSSSIARNRRRPCRGMPVSGVANPFAAAWDDLAQRETVDPATRIFGLWSAAATPFYVFVIRPTVGHTSHVNMVRQALANARIAHVIPPDFLHITVQSLGIIDEGGLTEGIADELAGVVADALAHALLFAIRLRGVSSFGSAAFVAVHEDDSTQPLQTMQRAVVATLLDANRVPVRHPERSYLPHLSVCYYDRAYPAEDILRVLTPFRAEDFGALRIDGIDLVKVVGNGAPYPPMEIVRRIPLGGAG